MCCENADFNLWSIIYISHSVIFDLQFPTFLSKKLRDFQIGTPVRATGTLQNRYLCTLNFNKLHEPVCLKGLVS